MGAKEARHAYLIAWSMIDIVYDNRGCNVISELASCRALFRVIMNTGHPRFKIQLNASNASLNTKSSSNLYVRTPLPRSSLLVALTALMRRLVRAQSPL